MKVDIKQLFDAEAASPLYVAINRVLVGNDPDMGDQLSHIWIDQFTYWESWEAHEDFHETFADAVRSHTLIQGNLDFLDRRLKLFIQIVGHYPSTQFQHGLYGKPPSF